ncbi:glycerophosphodiester phosphodiesterase family protein [Arthrobacter burdickii]|uniref:Glycerophosphodiester phosphodiesterase family protein n=1 Tax=Arthrobacter burdickii TaxID=3035920 RepID=A0ABT8JY39_9MICC|nr:glycerophosphodiester phosphodiesterase family protein [Arthrobacter burdickii]MDN4609733.1 glycerophosphodiester phosphodiesterase family protein [Arthrobacter burdickii]
MRRSARPDPGRYPYLDNRAGTQPGPLPLALAHRGFSPGGGENTMAAFERAVDLGFRYLEIDVRASGDGVVMVFHDEDLDRATDARGPIARRSASDLGGLSVGGHGGIPTLEALLLRWPHVRLNIDVKSDDCVRPFAELINRLSAHDRVLVASFSDRRRRAVLQLLERPTASSAGMAVDALLKLLAPLGLAGPVARIAGVQALQVPETYRGVRVVTRRFLRSCRAAGLQVHVWTINERAEMDRLLDLGVDGLVSDAADVLADCMTARSAWPQGGPRGG